MPIHFTTVTVIDTSTYAPCGRLWTYCNHPTCWKRVTTTAVPKGGAR